MNDDYLEAIVRMGRKGEGILNCTSFHTFLSEYEYKGDLERTKTPIQI